MLISFADDGSVEFTRSPMLLDLFDGEQKSVKRMSLVEHDDGLQAYTIKFVLGPFAGKMLAPTDEFYWDEFIHEFFSDPDTRLAFGQCVYFPTYEDGVRVEIAYIEFLRLTGRVESMHA